MSGASEASGAGALILSRSDIASLMEPADYLEAVEKGFRAAAEGRAHSPPPMAIDAIGGMFHAKGASLRLDRSVVALKLNGNFPDNPGRGLPTIQGAILLCDGESGSLLAIMDSIEITVRRTAAATALAARFLARPNSETVLVCGCGGQAKAQIEALADILQLRRCLTWDREHDKAEALAVSLRDSSTLNAEPALELRHAAAMSDVIVTCTTSRTPFLAPDMVRAGTFVAAVGADSPEKSEIMPDLMARSVVVADVLEQCLMMGDIHHAVSAGVLDRSQVHAELADLVVERRPGRTDDAQITLFDSTGTALQDVASAAIIYERALAGSRLSVDLGRA